MMQHNIVTKQIPNNIILPKVVELLNNGHSVTLPLRGYSMRPFLEDRRDKAILKKAETIDVGDVVLAEVAPQVYVLHRIMVINGNDITLQGDGNLSTEKCKRKDIHGIAVGFIRKGRSATDYTNGRKWRLYSAVWTWLLPIRRYLLFIHRQMLRIF